MIENLPDWKKRLYLGLLMLPIVLAVIWLIYIKVTEEHGGIGKGNFFSPIDTSKFIVVLIIFLFVYIFFIGMIFFDDIKEMIASRFRR